MCLTNALLLGSKVIQGALFCYLCLSAYTIWNLSQTPECKASDGPWKCLSPLWDTQPDGQTRFDLYVYTRLPGDDEPSLLWSRRVTPFPPLRRA